MRQNRIYTDFHRMVRVVYRYYRKMMGKERAQDECLNLFKIVFPEQYAAESGSDDFYVFSDEALERLAALFDKWSPQGPLRLLCEYTLEKAAKMQERDAFIQFCKDITPVVMRIRKLTPVETGRLMGLRDDEIQKMFDAGLSRSSMYKCHGNSIVVDVLFHIFRKLLVEPEPDTVKGEPVQMSLF